MAKTLVANLTWEVASNYQKKQDCGLKFSKRNTFAIETLCLCIPPWSSQSIFAYRDIIKRKL